MTSENVKGFKDYLGSEAVKRAAVREIIEDCFRLYGFEPAETPTIENLDFVKGQNSDDEAVSDVFKLQDRGKRKLGLRYEFTFQLKRIAKGQKLPYKRYQIGKVFRDEPIKTGRYREFVQCDADIVGSSELVSDAEILSLVKTVFSRIGIPIEIQVNNRKLLNSIIGQTGVRDKKTAVKIIREIDKLDKDMVAAKKNLVRILGKQKTDELLDYFDKPLDFFLQQSFPGAADISELGNLCSLYGIKLSFSPDLARGLSYYTGNVFEIITKKSDLAICAGGRYELDSIPAVGISFGLDRISELAKKIDKRSVDCLVISIGQDKKAIKLVEQLRKKGKSCSIMFGKPGKAMEYANSKEIAYVVFVGAEEVKKGKFKLRNMKTGREKLVSSNKLIKSI